jgi:tetratricopeptide (TPR) repeat protein
MATAAPPRVPRAPFLVAAAAALPYLGTLGHGFAFDDGVVIVRNHFLREGWGGLPALLGRTEWAGAGLEVPAWRPLTALTYALTHALAGLEPCGWHLGNLLLHAAVALLAWRLAAALGLTARAALLAGLLVAVHPLHVEAVANVVGRKDLLAAGFALAAALLHLGALDLGGWRLAAAPLAGLAAMLSKEVGAVTVGLVAVAELVRGAGTAPSGQRGGGHERAGVEGPDARDGAHGPLGPSPSRPGRPGRRGLLYASHLSALALYLLLRHAVTGGLVTAGDVPFEDNPLAHSGALVRFATALAVVGKGLLLHVLPVGQSPDWSFDAIPLVRSALDPRLLGSLLALAAWAGAGLALRRRAPVVLGGLAWYLVALLPASNLLFPAGTLFGERLLYLPGVGAALAAGWALGRFLGPDRARRPSAAAPPTAPDGAERRRAGVEGRHPGRLRALAVGAALLLLAGATARYAAAWSDDLTLFRRAEARVPRSAKVHHKLATLLLERGDAPAALAEVETALSIWRGSPRAHLAHGAILAALGRPAEAAAAYLEALALEPSGADALYELGRLARDRGALDEAAGWWERAVAARPTHAGALSDLAALALWRGEAARARALAERAVDADGTLAPAWYTLGQAAALLGDPAASRRALGRFVEVAGPEYAPEAAAVRKSLGAR